MGGLALVTGVGGSTRRRRGCGLAKRAIGRASARCRIIMARPRSAPTCCRAARGILFWRGLREFVDLAERQFMYVPPFLPVEANMSVTEEAVVAHLPARPKTSSSISPTSPTNCCRAIAAPDGRAGGAETSRSLSRMGPQLPEPGIRGSIPFRHANQYPLDRPPSSPNELSAAATRLTERRARRRPIPAPPRPDRLIQIIASSARDRCIGDEDRRSERHDGGARQGGNRNDQSQDDDGRDRRQPQFLPGAARQVGARGDHRALADKGYDAVVLTPEDSKFGAVETFEDAKRCAELFRRTAIASTA